LLTSPDEAVHQDGALVPMVQSKMGALTTPQRPPSSRVNAVPSEGSDILDFEPSLVGLEKSPSICETESPETGSTSTHPTSYPPSETCDTNSDLPNAVHRAPFVNRSILDGSAQLLHHVLVALNETDDTGRRPNSSVPGVWDGILKTDGTCTLFVKIMTSITENLVKCNRRIAKSAWNVAQERSREVERNIADNRNRYSMQRPHLWYVLST
jgi:hypothetical protein